MSSDQPRTPTGQYTFKAAGKPLAALESPVLSTQEEVDAALAAGAADLRIKVPAGRTITVRDARVNATGEGYLEAHGRSSVEVNGPTTSVFDDSRVYADSGHVRLFDRADGEIDGSAYGEVHGEATLGVVEDARASAFDKAQVRVMDEAVVAAYGESCVEVLDGSPTVYATDWAHVVLDEHVSAAEVVTLGDLVEVERTRAWLAPDNPPDLESYDVSSYPASRQTEWGLQVREGLLPR